MMKQLYTRVTQEWNDLDIAYPQWVITLVMDETRYITTLVVACIACFEVGMIIGIVWTIV